MPRRDAATPLAQMDWRTPGFIPGPSVPQRGIREPPGTSSRSQGADMTLRGLIDWLMNPPESAPRSAMLIRLMAGGVFFWEGILKFVYVNQGIGRFTKIGIPAPGPMAHFVAILEIVGGLLLACGFLTRLIAIPFVIEMIVAILSTKVALYLGTSPLPLPPPPPQMGVWAV